MIQPFSDFVKRGACVIATDIGTRLQDLRSTLGWTQEKLADAVGRRPNAISEWERGVRVPPESALIRLCRNHDWPPEMFEEGGPMPRELVNRLAGTRETPTPYLGSRGRAHRYFVGVMRDLMDDLQSGRDVPAATAIGYVNGLWNEATREAPQLMRPAVNGSQDAGNEGTG